MRNRKLNELNKLHYWLACQLYYAQCANNEMFSDWYLRRLRAVNKETMVLLGLNKDWKK